MQLKSTFDESLKLLTSINEKEVSVTGFEVNMLNLQFYVNGTLDLTEVRLQHLGKNAANKRTAEKC